MQRKNHSIKQDPPGADEAVPHRENDVADEREKLAQLIGRMLARHWIRSRGATSAHGESEV